MRAAPLLLAFFLLPASAEETGPSIKLPPYTACYLSVLPFSDNPYPLGEGATIFLPGSLARRRGIFAYTEAGPFFHAPGNPPLPGAGLKAPGTKTYDDTFHLHLKTSGERWSYLVYKERFKKQASKRPPDEKPSSFALYPVAQLDDDTVETAQARRLSAPAELSDAVSTIRPELARRIESMAARHRLDKKIARGKDIMKRPGRSAYYRSLKPCRGFEDHAFENAVERTREYFLEQRGR